MPEVMMWSGPRPEVCDLCGEPIEGVFYDACIKHGPWGILDQKCMDRYGVGLGTGMGQKYDAITLQKLEG